MKTIVNYAKEETRSFEELPFNDVDSLILSSIVYLDMKGDIPELFSKGNILLKDLDVNKFEYYARELTDRKKYISLIKNVVKNPRYNNLRLDNYYEKESIEEVMGFKAMTFEDTDFIYVAYMGTRTASMISWKEDFNLAIKSPLPSQKLACRYLDKVMLETLKPIYVGGHSKGGNLAIYSSMHTFLINKLRIKKIFNHDGPGFMKQIIESRRYKSIKNKISKTLPSGSIFGVLLYSDEPQRVIKSSGIGVNQHSPLNWYIKNGDFVYLKDLSWATKQFDKSMSDWVEGLSEEEMTRFIDALFSILLSDEFDPLAVPNRNYIKMFTSVRKVLKDMDNETKDMLLEVIKRFVEATKNNILNSND